jgi:hypothetical protein
VRIDTWTALEASGECGDKFTDEVFGFNIDDPWGIKWITQTSAGENWAEDNGFDDPIIFSPSRECKSGDPRPTLDILSPNDGAHLTDAHVDVRIVAHATANFDEWVLEWRRGDSGSKDWHELDSGGDKHENPDVVYTLDLEDLPRGTLVLRLRMESTGNGYAEVEIVIYNDLPEPTPIPTNTPQPTATVTNTPPPSNTPTAAPTNTSAPPTNTPLPSNTVTTAPSATNTP